MQIGMMNRSNVGEYMKLIEGMNGGKKAHNPMDDVKALDPAKKNTPCDVKAPRPDFNKMPTKSRAKNKSDSQYAEEIKQLARKTFATGMDKEAYKKLRFDFVSNVSPDREKIYDDNRKQLGGKLNASLAYFTPDNKPILAFHPQGGWHFFPTDAERARGREFNEIYNAEMDRMIAKHGRGVMGSMNQSQYEAFEKENQTQSVTYRTNSFDMKV